MSKKDNIASWVWRALILTLITASLSFSYSAGVIDTTYKNHMIDKSIHLEGENESIEYQLHINDNSKHLSEDEIYITKEDYRQDLIDIKTLIGEASKRNENSVKEIRKDVREAFNRISNRIESLHK